ncbi:MAG: hypothetical protein A2V99_18800 [Spirochaetes bacterium RBG_16_67_19]|nr:MAG: hypothetical protein A2V99_18800 [Spirochaetes bacterium RBG_16_67_19]
MGSQVGIEVLLVVRIQLVKPAGVIAGFSTPTKLGSRLLQRLERCPIPVVQSAGLLQVGKRFLQLFIVSSVSSHEHEGSGVGPANSLWIGALRLLLPLEQPRPVLVGLAVAPEPLKEQSPVVEDGRSAHLDFLEKLQAGLEVSPTDFPQAEPETCLVQNRRQLRALDAGFRKEPGQGGNLQSVVFFQQQQQVEVEDGAQLPSRRLLGSE